MENEERKILVGILKADKIIMDKLKEENKKLKEKILKLEYEIWGFKMHILEEEIEKYMERFNCDYTEMDEEMKQEYDKACTKLAEMMEV